MKRETFLKIQEIRKEIQSLEDYDNKRFLSADEQARLMESISILKDKINRLIFQDKISSKLRK